MVAALVPVAMTSVTAGQRFVLAGSLQAADLDMTG
jgi:hypothetical protein